MNDNQRPDNAYPFDYEGKAATVRKAQRYLQGVFREDLDDPDFASTHDERVSFWQKSLDAAYPPEFWENAALLHNRNLAGLPLIIEFLEADPWFFRTGYIKERLIRHIIRLDLSIDHTKRLQNVVLAVIDKRYRREFRAYCRLARKVDSPEFRSALQERLIQPNPDIKRRALWVLDGLEKGVPNKGKYGQEWAARRNAPLSPAFFESMERLRSGESEFMEDMISTILERDSWGFFNRQGRVKCEIVRVLAEVSLSLDHKQRLQTIVLSVVDRLYPYGFEHYCHLASNLDTLEFRSQLTQRLVHSDYHVRRRAQLVLGEMDRNGDH